MNILTAPLTLLGGTPPGLTIQTNFAPSGGGAAPPNTLAMRFLSVGAWISILLIVGGFYLLLGGHAPANLEATFKDIGIKTGDGGIAMAGLGVLLYLGVGWVVLVLAKEK